MYIKIEDKLKRDYTISFFAGLAASITILFGLDQAGNLVSLRFLITIIVLYFVGLFCCVLIECISKKQK